MFLILGIIIFVTLAIAAAWTGAAVILSWMLIDLFLALLERRRKAGTR